MRACVDVDQDAVYKDVPAYATYWYVNTSIRYTLCEYVIATRWR